MKLIGSLASVPLPDMAPADIARISNGWTRCVDDCCAITASKCRCFRGPRRRKGFCASRPSFTIRCTIRALGRRAAEYFPAAQTKMKHFKAIAAMSLNRVIGRGRQTPLALAGRFQVVQKDDDGQCNCDGPQDVRGPGAAFAEPQKPGADAAPPAAHQKASGNFRTIPRMARWEISATALPVSFLQIGVKKSRRRFSFSARWTGLDPAEFPNDIFIWRRAAQIYEQALPRCADLYLTLVKREVEGGDAFFRPFEDKFELAGNSARRVRIQNSALPAQVADEINQNRGGRRAAVPRFDLGRRHGNPPK